MLGSLIVIILLLEIVLRVTGVQKAPALNPPIYQAHENPEISYTLIPSHQARAYGSKITTNVLGFRSSELPENAEPIVILGDSLVFGHGVGDKQTVGYYLQRHLRPNEHVLSAGLNGYNIMQERAVYEESLKPLNPKALILVFMPNDFDEAFKLDGEGYFRPLSDESDMTYMEKVKRDVNRPGTISMPFKAFLQTRSAVFTFLERATKALPFRSRTKRPNIFSSGVTDEELQNYAKEFRKLSRIAGDIPKMLVVWPEENLQLETRSFLSDLAGSEGWAYLDLYGVYGNKYESLGWDGHPSAKTNKKTAKILVESLEVFGLL